MRNLNKARIAVVADWLVTYAGAERVVSEILEVFPQADLFAVVDFMSEEGRKRLKDKHARTTFIQNLPHAKSSYQRYLPLMTLAIEQIDVSQYDIVISSSHAVAKGVITGPDQLHVSYIHSPIRYAWDLQHQYLQQSGLDKGLKGWLAKLILHNVRIWDYRTSSGVDHFIANSHYIARRIKKIYNRPADVIYPPVDVQAFSPVKKNKEDFYFTASRMVPYKKMDLIVQAFSHMPDKRLVVIGDGSEMPKVKRAAGANVEILGYQSNEVLCDYMQRARAFLFAAEEDFGISPVEAQAAGTPVIAFGKGGALETVRPPDAPEPTGVFFEEQTVESIVNAITEFEANELIFQADNCIKNALRFSAHNFRQKFFTFVSLKWEDHLCRCNINY